MSTAYELLVQEIHQALLHSDGVESINVLHNVKVKGKSGATHQIDVYWEFKLAGVVYKTCIECKHYASFIKKTHIASFAAILEDIGNATGIFATTHGYQEGALLFAKERGIRLLLINNLIKQVNVNFHIQAPSTTVTGVKYNQAQISECLKSKGLESFKFELSWWGGTQFYDRDGNATSTLRELLKGRAGASGKLEIETPGLYDKTEIGLIELESISFSVEIRHAQEMMEVKSNSIERAIVEDVINNASQYLNDDGSITNIETWSDT